MLFHSFLILALDEDEQLTTCHGPFITRKDFRYVLNMRVRAPQTWCRHFGEEKDHLLLLAFLPRLYQLNQLGYCDSSTRVAIVTNAGFH
jgi:hypothetical protein